MKIEEMEDVFLNSANFAPHAFLTLAPPSGYALNLKALIKVSKVSWRSQPSKKYLDLHLKENKTNFVSCKKLLPSHSGLRGLRMPNFWQTCLISKLFFFQFDYIAFTCPLGYVFENSNNITHYVFCHDWMFMYQFDMETLCVRKFIVIHLRSHNSCVPYVIATFFLRI